MEEAKYFEVRNKYLAEGLAFLNFRYYKFQKDSGKTIYSFKDTQELRNTISKLLKMKKGV